MTMRNLKKNTYKRKRVVEVRGCAATAHGLKSTSASSISKFYWKSAVLID